MICIAAAAGVIALAADAFTLHWTHSVARTSWTEQWETRPDGLLPVKAQIEGPGAGMELPAEAWREGNVWHYIPKIAPQPEVYLAASGATQSGWTLCTTEGCLELGAEESAPLRIWSSPDCHR